MISEEKFCCTGMIDNQHAGETTAPILRVFVHNKVTEELLMTKTFNNLQDVSLAKPKFDYIHIIITIFIPVI